MTSKWIVITILLLIAVVAAALLARKSVRAELTIQATPEEVWAVLTDPTSYKDWNPILVSVAGEFVEGRKLSVEMANPDGSTTNVTPLVKKLVPNTELNQFGGFFGVLTYDHTWTLKAVDGGTRVTQFEEYRGIGVWFWDPEWVGRAYRQANENLKLRLEN